MSGISFAKLRITKPAFCTTLAYLSVIYFIVFALPNLMHGRPPYYCIFTNAWMSGRAALGDNPAAWFDVHIYNAAISSLFHLPLAAPVCNWSYPPHIMLFTWIFGLLPYMAAWALWGIAGFAAYFLTATQGEQRLDRLFFIAAWPACTLNYFCGQNGFFSAALIIGGLTQLEKRPILAGILFGLLTLKPQLGLLLPVVLLLTRNWRCIIAATSTTLALAVITAFIYGVDIWSAYFHIAMHQQAVVFRDLAGWHAIAMPTVFMNMRFFGVPVDLAWMAQAPVSLAALAAVIWTYWRPRDPVLSQALLVTASFLITPYVWTYDMVVFGWVFAKLRERNDNTLMDDLVMLGVWALPIMATPFPFRGVPAFAGFLVLLMARLLSRLRDSSRGQFQDARHALASAPG